MLEDVKTALRISTNAYDVELTGLIAAAQLDLGIAGVTLPEEIDALVKTAIISYCKFHFGDPDKFERWKACYDEQKAQLSMATGYTTWIDQT